MPTHEVHNQVPELVGYNLFETDRTLRDAVARYARPEQIVSLQRFGEKLGSADVLHLAESANRHPPELSTHDRNGYRVDTVEFHPAWHALLRLLREEGLHAPADGGHLVRAAGYFLQAQVEAGSLCPTTMTCAAIPVLRNEPVLFAELEARLQSRQHDPRDIPIAQKKSILIGMGMTEKQGGSDVRSNATVARPLGPDGRGHAYALTGHKWFFSAPMCDAHLVLARTESGLSCFFVPRWRPDGSKNSILIQRLKNKLGNCSNASSEVEFEEAFGIMVGDDGRGVPTIIEMANSTRLDCVIGSAALMRQALVQAIHHARHRMVFGKPLLQQPLMRNVLCDLALESEAATLLMLRLAQSCEHHDDPLERAWRRIVTPAAKFWICKRALEFTGECMEVWGGNGYVETGPMARLYREAPVNSIWEGSGNVMCLDVLRAVERDAPGFALLLESITTQDPVLASPVAQLRTGFDSAQIEREILARRLVQQLVLLLQCGLMRQHAPPESATAFISSRSDPAVGRVYGTLVSAQVQESVLERSWSRQSD